MHIMENIAPAVLNGGFSSILALSLLVTSRSHIFTSFFKIFFMICVFGLFHGLIMLPVVLCVLGPTDPLSDESKKEPKTSNESNHHLAKRFSRDISEKYLQENISNLETEQRELEVFVPSTESGTPPSTPPHTLPSPPPCEPGDSPCVTDSLLQQNNVPGSEESTDSR